MNANKTPSKFSIKKIWDKLLQHDKAMNSTILVLSSGNWVEQEDGTFKNTVSYKGFTENDKLTVDLYDDGSLSETQLDEYEQYIDGFEIIDGALVATANTKPTQSLTVVIKGDFMTNEASVDNVTDLINEINKTNEELEKTNEALGGYCFYNNPEVIFIASTNEPYVNVSENYILSDSDEGKRMLESSTYTTGTVEGNYYRIAGADSVFPFKSGDDSEQYKKMIVDSLEYTKLGLTYDSSWEEIASGMNKLFPATLNVLSYLGVSSIYRKGGNTTWTSEEFDITNFNKMSVSASWNAYSPWHSAWGSKPTQTAYLVTSSGNISLLTNGTIDISGYTGTAYISIRTDQRKITATNSEGGTSKWTVYAEVNISKLLLQV